MLDKKKDKVQQEALKAWVKAGGFGTLEMITGLGKTFTALHAVNRLSNHRKILFLAETTLREATIREDIKKFNKIFGVDLFTYDIEFACYQSAYKWKDRHWDLVIADEIHDSLTPAYIQFYDNNTYDQIMGLSATIDRKTKYEIEDELFITKGEYIDEVAPVCFSYGINEGQKDGTARELEIYVIQHVLDGVTKNIEGGNAKKRFMTTELATYNFWTKNMKKAFFIKNPKAKEGAIFRASGARSKVLYTAPSKIKAGKELLAALTGRTILFGNDIDALLQMTKNVVSSRNSDEKNAKILKDFEKGKISLIGSFKMLKQGANLKNLDDAVIHSYYSKSKDLIQRIGRLRQNGKIGRVFIFQTVGTQEDKWIQTMFEGINSLKIIRCANVQDCLKQLK